MLRNNPSCDTCTNNSCLIRARSGDDGASAFLKQKSTIVYKKSQNVIIEGSPVHGLYFVHSGTVKVLNTGIQGREQILRITQEGEMIGIRGFSTRQAYQVGAVALTDAVVCTFQLDLMKDMLLNLPKLTYDLMNVYAEELLRSETKVRKFAHMNVREKVVDSLLYIHRKFGQENDFLTLPLSRKEIADLAGTTEEQAIRTISALKKDGLIHTKVKKIGIPDVEKLRKEISEHHYFIQS